jgi:hypothetical protein
MIGFSSPIAFAREPGSAAPRRRRVTAELSKLFRKCRALYCQHRKAGLRIVPPWLT